MYRRYDYLSEGQLPVYPIVKGTSAFVVGETGQNVLVIKSNSVFIPLFELTATGTTEEMIQQFKQQLRDRVQGVKDAMKAAGVSLNTLVVAVRTKPTVLSETEAFMLCGIGAMELPATGGFREFPFETADVSNPNTTTLDIRQALGIK